MRSSTREGEEVRNILISSLCFQSKENMMKYLIALCLLVVASTSNAVGTARDNQFDPYQVNMSSPPVIFTVIITSYSMTSMKAAENPGSFSVELQNNSTSYDSCCAFDVDASTVIGAGTNKCRIVAKSGGTWSIAAWWRDITLYCQSLNSVNHQHMNITVGSK